MSAAFRNSLFDFRGNVTLMLVGRIPQIVCVLAVTGSAFSQFKPSKNEQVKLGKQAADSIRKKEKVLPETDVRVITLRRVAKRITDAFPPRKDPKGKPDPWTFTFDVIANKEINAFALPGGPTFFYTGLLEKMTSEDELAAVIGHELTHVRQEHWATAFNESQRRQLGFALLSFFKIGGNDLQQAAVVATELVYDLPFSRRHETEADDQGMNLMVTAGFNPQGMVDTFEMLRKLVGNGGAPEWANTHPDDKNRIKHVQDRISKLGKDFGPLTPMSLPKEPVPPKAGGTAVVG